MATPLTWREVTAPDFGTALRGIGLAGNNISQGFNTLGDALGKFQTYRQDQAANQVLNNAAGFTDPTALRSAIADGSLFGGIDRSLVTPQTLAALNLQPGTLLSQGVTQEQLTHAKEVDPLLTQGQSLLNQGRQISNTVDAATASDRIRAAALANTKTSADIGLTTANTGNVSAQTANLTQNMNNNQTMFSRGTTAYDADQEALPYLNDLKTKINTPDDAHNLIASLPPGMSQMARQKVIDAATGSLNGGAPMGAPGPATRALAGAASAPGTAGTMAGSSADIAFKLLPTSIPLSSQSIGEVQNFQNTELKSKTGGTPVGTYQITSDTLSDYGPKVLGADWKKQQFTPENQDKIGEAIFDARKSGNLSKTWSSLPDLGEGGYANMSWEQIRPLIAKGETKDDTLDRNQEIQTLHEDHSRLSARSGAATTAIETAISQAGSNNINEKYADALKDKSTIGEITANMVAGTPGKDGKINPTSTSAYRDLPQSRLVNTINDIMHRVPGANEATALAIMEKHTKGADFVDRNLPGFLGGHGIIPDDEAITKEIDALNNGTTFRANKANQQAQALSGIITSAQKAHDKATQDLYTALTNRSLSPQQIANYRNTAALTRAVLEEKLQAQADDKTLNFKQNTSSPGEVKGSGADVLVPALRDTPANAPAARAIQGAVAPGVPGWDISDLKNMRFRD